MGHATRGQVARREARAARALPLTHGRPPRKGAPREVHELEELARHHLEGSREVPIIVGLRLGVEGPKLQDVDVPDAIDAHRREG
eukprot:1429565-Alexandrium_andersonii.AAC.1